MSRLTVSLVVFMVLCNLAVAQPDPCPCPKPTPFPLTSWQVCIYECTSDIPLFPSPVEKAVCIPSGELCTKAIPAGCEYLRSEYVDDCPDGDIGEVSGVAREWQVLLEYKLRGKAGTVCPTPAVGSGKDKCLALKEANFIMQSNPCYKCMELVWYRVTIVNSCGELCCRYCWSKPKCPLLHKILQRFRR